MKSIPVSEDWLEEYQEAEINYKKSTVRQSVMDKLFMEMPNYNQELIAARRKQMRNHQTVCNQLKNLIKLCAAGKIDNNDFYGEFE